MLCLWRRMGEEDRGRLWQLYGWFSGLMTCGSCFGAVSWAARMMFLVNGFKENASADRIIPLNKRRLEHFPSVGTLPSS